MRWQPCNVQSHTERALQTQLTLARLGVYLCVGLLCLLRGCYTEKASPTRHRPERQHNAVVSFTRVYRVGVWFR